jgi:hypothetical protein
LNNLLANWSKPANTCNPATFWLIALAHCMADPPLKIL